MLPEFLCHILQCTCLMSLYWYRSGVGGMGVGDREADGRDRGPGDGPRR